MAFVQDFSVTQSANSPAYVGLTDTSTGSDGAITSRRVYIQSASGTYLVESGTTTDYEIWPYSDSTISLNVLTEDQCVSITVQWLNVLNAVLYTKTQQYALSEFNKQFAYSLVELQAQTPGVYQDTNYASNFQLLWMNIVAGINAVELGDDIAAGQACFNRATEMRLNESFYF